jgi:hypothetical protein
MQVEPDHRLLGIDRRPASAPRNELIANGVLDPQSSKKGVRDLRIAHIAIDGQRMFGSQILGPVDRLYRLIQFIGRLDIGFVNRLQNANGRAQPEVRFVERGLLADEGNAAPAGCDFFCADLAKFVRQHWFEAAGAGCEEVHG